VPAGDTEALQDALIRIKRDSQLGKRLAQASYAEVRSNHLWQHRLEKITEIMESLSPATGKSDKSSYANKL
jgi:glycosyltransferase involved in cell wall biosynthesis